VSSRRGIRLAGASAVATALTVLTACGGSSGGGSSANSSAPSDGKYTGPAHSHTLKVAWSAAEMPFDPATYYGGPGFGVMDGLYDGLVKYEVGGVKVEGDIARSWTISPDGRTYTFTLKSGLKFHDGTAVDATAVKYSFQRFIDFKSSPSYMLAQVTSMDAPDATTFVMHLSAPVDPMLDYLASFVGPKVLSPATLTAHAGKDKGATWLATHDAGSGPYELASVVQDQSYSLRAFTGYLGTKPYYTSIDISIVPNVTTQVLELQKGDIDVIPGQIPANLVKTLQGEKDISVKTYPGLLKTVVWVKKTGFLATAGATDAIKSAINRDLIVKGADGVTGKVSKDLDLLPIVGSGATNDVTTYDPSKLTDLVKKQSAAPSITLGYPAQAATDKLAAELIQTELQAAGLKVTLKPLGLELFEFPANPAKAPDLTLLSTNADAASSGTWLTAYFSSHGALTLNGAKTPAADALLEKGITSPSHAEAVKYYRQAAQAYADSGAFFTIADITPTVAYQKSVGTIATTPANPFGPMFAETGP
jgi:peptide/nickel transport system substrate-binding protein